MAARLAAFTSGVAGIGRRVCHTCCGVPPGGIISGRRDCHLRVAHYHSIIAVVGPCCHGHRRRLPHSHRRRWAVSAFSFSAPSSSSATTLSSRSISYRYGANFRTIVPLPSQLRTPWTVTLHRWSVILSCEKLYVLIRSLRSPPPINELRIPLRSFSSCSFRR